LEDTIMTALRYTTSILAAFAVTAAAGCMETKTGPTPAGQVGDPQSLDWTKTAALTAATGCEQAETWLENAAITQMDLSLESNRRCFLDSESCGWHRGVGGDMAEGAPNGPPVSSPTDDGTPDEYSETNTQVEGVDEADRVKTDGEHVYVMSDRDFVVVKSWPAAQTDELGRVRLRTYPQSFFIDGNKAIVLGSANLYDVSSDAPRPDGADVPTPTEPAGDSGSSGDAANSEAKPEGDSEWGGYYGYRQVSTVTVIDLADKANPRVIKEYFFDGYSLDSRKIGPKVYLAQNSYIYFNNLSYWPNDLNWYGGEQDRPSAEVVNAAFDALHVSNVAAIRARSLDEWLPRVWTSTNGGDVAFASGGQVGSCTDVHVPSVYSGQGLLSLVSLDVATGDTASSTIQGTWGNVYASPDAIYVGSTNYDFMWWWMDSDDVPSVKTHIHKFAFDTAGNARYAASGEVLGYAINQFAFDEFDGHLRVATTDGFGWWNNEQTESRVTVLHQEGNRLAQTGVVTGLGLGERIFSVRFIGVQGYVVTFRQVDPLYVIDLSNPAAPTVAGELKIPGFSSYIHPLEPGYLLTAGRDGDEEGNIGGIKIEIFDVRNPADPKSVKSAVIGDGWNTWSDVLWDHKAFSYFAARDLLAIPVSGWVETQSANGWWGEYKSELALFRVTTSDIEVLPSVSHMGFFDDFGGNDNCRYYSGYWQAQIYRGIFIEDYVYSLSQLGLQVHDTRNLEAGPVAELSLLDPASFPYYDWGWCEGYVDGGEVPPPDEGDGDKPAAPADPSDPSDPGRDG